MLDRRFDADPSGAGRQGDHRESKVDAYFSADVETDGPIPGPFSILSFALVYAGSLWPTLRTTAKLEAHFLQRAEADFDQLPRGGVARKSIG